MPLALTPPAPQSTPVGPAVRPARPAVRPAGPAVRPAGPAVRPAGPAVRPGWISIAIGRRRTTPELLSKALAARSRIRWRTWITAALVDTADGVHSPLERHYVSGVERAHGLPAARRQAKRRHGSGRRYLDNFYENYGVCVELDGAAAHPAEGRWRDTRRDNVNLVQGTETLRYGWPDATEHRCRTAAEIGALLRRHGWKGTIRPCSPTCQAVR